MPAPWRNGVEHRQGWYHHGSPRRRLRSSLLDQGETVTIAGAGAGDLDPGFSSRGAQFQGRAAAPVLPDPRASPLLDHFLVLSEDHGHRRRRPALLDAVLDGCFSPLHTPSRHAVGAHGEVVRRWVLPLERSNRIVRDEGGKPVLPENALGKRPNPHQGAEEADLARRDGLDSSENPLGGGMDACGVELVKLINGHEIIDPLLPSLRADPRGRPHGRQECERKPRQKDGASLPPGPDPQKSERLEDGKRAEEHGKEPGVEDQAQNRPAVIHRHGSLLSTYPAAARW